MPTITDLGRRIDAGDGGADIDVRELAASLGVTIAWRPWPRRWLTQRERHLISQALTDSGYKLLRDIQIPRPLSRHVRVVRAPLDAAPLGAKLIRATRLTVVRLIGLVGLAAAAVTLWPALFPTTKAPAPLGGKMNFAVIPFQTPSGRGSDQLAARTLSWTLVGSLTEALKHGDPQVVPDVRMVSDASLAHGTSAKESQTLAAFAERINADAVIFGEVDQTPTSTTVTPSVYVAPPKLFGASEFAGVYPLGDPIRLPVSLGSSAPGASVVRQALTNRAAGLALFIDAIGYSSLERFPDAVRYLLRAAKAPGWRSPRAQGLLDLFLGNATAKLGLGARLLSSAERFYRAALSQIPAFARAHLGLAEITFQRAHGDCTRHGVDARGLEEALAQYHAIVGAASQSMQSPERHVLEIKVHFGVGRVYLCQSQAELAARWASARRELSIVASAYPHDGLLRDDAAEALGDLAIVELPQPGQRDARNAYLQARASYSRAIALTEDPSALPALYANRAFVASRLGERTNAAADHEMAARLKHDAERGASIQALVRKGS